MGGATQQMLMVNQQIAQLLQQHNQQQQAATVAACAPKSVRSKYPAQVDALMRLCEVTTEANLPPIWQELANCDKPSKISALEAAINARCNEIGENAPITTPELVERITGFRLTSTDLDNISEGLSPFLITVLTGPAAEASRHRSYVYKSMHEGNAAPTLDQIAELVQEGPLWPDSLFMLYVQMFAYSTVLDIVLGVIHRLCQAY
jgi:hypothetical protein